MNDLANPRGIAPPTTARHRLDASFQGQPLGGGGAGEGGGGPCYKPFEIKINHFEGQLAGLDLRDVQCVREDLQQSGAGLADDDQPLLLQRREILSLHRLDHSEDAVERSADFVADGGQERALGVGGLPRLAHRQPQLPVPAFFMTNEQTGRRREHEKRGEKRRADGGHEIGDRTTGPPSQAPGRCAVGQAQVDGGHPERICPRRDQPKVAHQIATAHGGDEDPVHRLDDHDDRRNRAWPGAAGVVGLHQAGGNQKDLAAGAREGARIDRSRLLRHTWRKRAAGHLGAPDTPDQRRGAGRERREIAAQAGLSMFVGESRPRIAIKDKDAVVVICMPKIFTDEGARPGRIELEVQVFDRVVPHIIGRQAAANIFGMQFQAVDEQVLLANPGSDIDA